jgi:hypothetical protein
MKYEIRTFWSQESLSQASLKKSSADITMTKSSVELEQLVQKIQKQLAPKAEVLHNVKMPGRLGGQERQVDVLVREQVGQYKINIIIECKDHKRPIDVKGVEEFSGLLNDVGAQKGVLVCPMGFSELAKTRAAGLQIDLYSPVDTDAHKWQVSASMPATCSFKSVAISFGFRMSAPQPFRIFPNFFSENVVYDMEKKELGTCYSKIVERWNNGEFSDILVSADKRVNIFEDKKVQADNGYGTLCPLDLTAGLYVNEYLYSGQLPIPKISGFKDEMTGKVITNAFAVGLLDPNEISEKWTQIKSIDELEVKPVIQLQGVVCWDQNARVILPF